MIVVIYKDIIRKLYICINCCLPLIRRGCESHLNAIRIEMYAECVLKIKLQREVWGSNFQFNKFPI